MERPIAECLDFEKFVGRRDAVCSGTRGTTTAQKTQKKGIMHRSHVVI